ncbi:peptide ABC transporter substrate-binding protein [Planomicrobium sp. CPCC 101079]|uniref:peptide ABC transporter substrate-binding protein n=1 Tax=Planomicrobium sp. CPCC 101079 TaxID=2599618 RepID=UPI0011B4ABB1|nr:peptide ABC transporter substrate-binding protein [Planomicrobium sp. CPCC 101079]TWT03552.1 peptide ABC transporter substrate-binding protein [Planomicrobium sp. CPCC 101079]
MKKWLVLFLMAMMAFVLAACTASQDAGEEPAEGEEGTAAETGGEKILRLNNAQEPTSFDPSIGFDAVSWNALNNLMEGLTRLDENSQPVEATAESIDISEDGKTYTFKIREDANWSNGETVKASDFVFGWRHMLDPETASPAAFLGYFIEGAEAYNTGEGSAEDVKVVAEDDKTLVVTLTAPTEAFLNIITNPNFFPIHEATATENPEWHTEAESFVGNGPFKLASWSHDEEFVFEKNEEYWDAANVKLDGVHWAMVNDTNTEYQMYQADELDVSSVPAELSEDLMESPEISILDQAGTYFYRYNVEEEPFTNKKVRQAFAFAVNQEDIVQYVTKNGEKPAHGFTSYGFEGPDGNDFRDTAGDLVKFDAEKAKQLLEEGMQEEGWETLPEVTLTFSTSDTHQIIAETLQDQFKQTLGVDVKLQSVESAVFAEEQSAFEYQASRSSFLHDYADPVNALESFITGSSMNRTQWSNPEFDQLIADAKTETDSQVRWEKLIEAEKLLMDEMPIFPIHFYNQVQLQKEGVSGVLRHPVGYLDLKNADKQ